MLLRSLRSRISNRQIQPNFTPPRTAAIFLFFMASMAARNADRQKEILRELRRHKDATFQRSDVTTGQPSENSRRVLDPIEARELETSSEPINTNSYIERFPSRQNPANTESEGAHVIDESKDADCPQCHDCGYQGQPIRRVSPRLYIGGIPFAFVGLVLIAVYPLSIIAWAASTITWAAVGYWLFVKKTCPKCTSEKFGFR